MASFRALLKDHSPVLLLDTAATHVFVGWFIAGQKPRWASHTGEAGVELFRGIDAVGATPGGAGAFVFCEGPGSVLGIRTAAMAIRSWCALQAVPVFAYQSLAVLAEASNFDRTWIADARRDAWHAYQPGGALRRVPAAELGGGPFATPSEFRRWAALPPGTTEVSYELPSLLDRAMDADLFRPAAQPDAFLHSEPVYATWEGKIHDVKAQA